MVVLERAAPGGQAGRSMRIENYLGFPTGISGSELADRAVLQANKFGARLPVPTPVQTLRFDGAYPILEIDRAETINAKCLLIATGAEYRHLPNIEVLYNTEVRAMSGDGQLRTVEAVNNKTEEVRTFTTPALFSFIGAVPRTDWLPPEIEKDAKGFVRTGADLAQSPHWTARRSPFLLETSRRGVFAAGDVRSGSVKRVASAVGEGAMAVQFVHEYFKEI
jgi:thioredoxin reductase